MQLKQNKINKVALVYSPLGSSFDNRVTQPLGICYLHAALNSAGINTKKYDCNSYNKILENDIYEILLKEEFDLVGFSVLEANFLSAKNIAMKLKQYNPKIIILFGGVYPTIDHIEMIQQHNFIDFIIRGEGEEAIVNLVNYLNGCTEFPSGITGYHDGNMIFSNEISVIEDITKLQFPNRFDYSNYTKNQIDSKELLIVTISSSRGCPYSCTFCSVASLNIKWRGRIPENVVEEIYIEYLKNKKIYIVFVDDNFFVAPDRALNIVKGIKRKCGIIPFSFATRTDQLLKSDESVIEYFSKNGCSLIEIGIENGSNSMLKRMNKNITAKDNLKVLKMLKKYSISIGVDFILFDNLMTIIELKENLQFFKDANLFGHFPPLIFNQMYPYKGTKFFEQNIDMNNYFVNKDIEKIYNEVEKFGTNIQVLISKKIREIKNINSNYFYFLELHLIPYKFLDELVEKLDDEHEFYKVYEKYSMISDNILEKLDDL